ncbi:MAG: alpha/beta hydrolase-fold protein [Bacteroidota bacterium]
MKRVLLIFFASLTFFCLLTCEGRAQAFTDFVARVSSAPEQRRQYMVDSMLTTVPGYPYSENDSTVWFFYQGSAFEASVAGDMNSWSETQSPLQRLSTTNLWYRGASFAPDSRIDYKLVVDGNWMLDPRNPYSISGGSGPSSELRMPDYIQPDEILRHAGIPTGTLIDTIFSSTALSNTRPVHIYLPPGYDSGNARYPVVLFHNGSDYLSLGSADVVLDNLIYEQRIPPCIGVFVPSLDRTQEYAGNQIDLFTDFIVNTVMRRVDSSYRTLMNPAARAMLGNANGGNIALYIAMKHPEVFGCVGAQSSNIITPISNAFSSGPVLPLRLYLDLGLYDIEVLIPLVKAFVPMLQTKGYNVLFHEFNEGHSWGSWRAHIDDALEFFFAHLLSTGNPVPLAARGFQVDPIWPNPAADHISLSVDLPNAAVLSITLCDVLGRELRTMHSAYEPAGTQHISLSIPSLQPGQYFLRVIGGESIQVRSVVIR